ncbi:hypothetical protein FA95DRAFT_1613474, partial [Auriscalpium vulgare]
LTEKDGSSSAPQDRGRAVVGGFRQRVCALTLLLTLSPLAPGSRALLTPTIGPSSDCSGGLLIIGQVVLEPPGFPTSTPSLDVEAELADLAEEEESPDVSHTVADVDGGHALTEDSAESSDHAALNAAAVAMQLQQRLDHELTVLLPRLHGIVVLLGDAPSVRADQRTEDFRSVLAQISSALPRTGGTHPEAAHVNPPQTSQNAQISSALPRTGGTHPEAAHVNPPQTSQNAKSGGLDAAWLAHEEVGVADDHFAGTQGESPLKRKRKAAHFASGLQDVLPLSPERKSSKRIKSYGTL